MAAAVAEQSWRRQSEPDAIEAGLAALWQEAGREHPLARAVMCNLVVFREELIPEGATSAPRASDLAIGEVARRHPCRVILLDHTRAAPKGGVPLLGASLTITAFGPPEARFGIEQIALRSACADASLPSIVRQLVLGDLPTSLWWTVDVSDRPPVEALVALARQLLYDSRGWGNVARGAGALTSLAGRPHSPDLGDLNWLRLTPLRLALTQAVDPALHPDARVRSVKIDIRHRPGEAALAWLVAGWFGASLAHDRAIEVPVVVRPQPETTAILTVRLGEGDPADITATMTAQRIDVSYLGGLQPFTIACPPTNDADLMSEQLTRLGRDTSMHDALTLVARWAAAEGV